MALDLATIAVDGVGDFFRSGGLKMHRLTGKRTGPAGDEEKPRQQLRPIGGVPTKRPAFSPR